MLENCFTKICRGCSHSVSQLQYSRRVKVVNLMEISSSTTIQRAAFPEKYLSEVPVTPLGRPKKIRGGKKGTFLSVDLFGLQQELGLNNSNIRQKLY